MKSACRSPSSRSVSQCYCVVWFELSVRRSPRSGANSPRSFDTVFKKYACSKTLPPGWVAPSKSLHELDVGDAGATFDEIAHNNQIMDLAEIIGFAKEYGLMPQFMNIEELKSLMHGQHEVAFH